MKKIVTIAILFVFICNPVLAEVVFYEDYSFHGEMVTDVRVNKVERSQVIQVAFPSFDGGKIPFILNGHAHYTEIAGKPAITLDFDKLSVGAKRHIPVKILVTSINARKTNQACVMKQSRYKQSLKFVNGYTKEVLMFPINRYKSNPTISKPNGKTFIMFLEPVYAIFSTILYALSPLTAFLWLDESTPDIYRGSVVEFEFLQQVTRAELNKMMHDEDL